MGISRNGAFATVLKLAILAPILAGFIVYGATVLPRHPSREELDGLLYTMAFVSFASLMLGFIPALIAAALYIAILRKLPRMARTRRHRCVLAALLGGLAGAIWCGFVVDLPPTYYSMAAACAAALLAIRWPLVRPPKRDQDPPCELHGEQGD